MIKVFCDKCGKEITDNINIEVEQIEAFSDGRPVATLQGKQLHYCDECVKENLTCGFKVGDKVITSDGRVGTITDICTCNNCKERGFYEPTVQTNIGNVEIYITYADKDDNFSSFYQIGDKVFGNLDEDPVREEINKLTQTLFSLEQQLMIIQQLKMHNRNKTK